MADLSKDEQTNVRTALRFLRARMGGWASVVAALRTGQPNLAQVMRGRTVSPAVAFRVARLAGVSIDGLLRGEYPPAGTCPHCGHCPTETQTVS